MRIGVVGSAAGISSVTRFSRTFTVQPRSDEDHRFKSRRLRPMRIIRFAKAPAAVFVSGRFWLGVGLIAVALNAMVSAEETQNGRTARLGFRFDQQARDAAIAAEKKSGVLEDLPADADVIRLPKYQVTEQRIPLEEHELLTPQGRLDVAKKRYLTPLYQKTLGPLAAVASLLNNPLGGWNPNGPEAMALYEDNENLRRRNRINELSEIAGLAEQAKRIKAEPSRQRARNAKKP